MCGLSTHYLILLSRPQKAARKQRNPLMHGIVGSSDQLGKSCAHNNRTCTLHQLMFSMQTEKMLQQRGDWLSSATCTVTSSHCLVLLEVSLQAPFSCLHTFYPFKPHSPHLLSFLWLTMISDDKLAKSLLASFKFCANKNLLGSNVTANHC